MYIKGCNINVKLSFILDQINPELLAIDHIDVSRNYLILNEGYHFSACYDTSNSKFTCKYEKDTKCRIIYDPGMEWLVIYDNIQFNDEILNSKCDKLIIHKIYNYLDNEYCENSKYNHIIDSTSLRQFFCLYDLIKMKFIGRII